MPRNHYFQKRRRQTGTGGISAIALSQPHTEEHVRRLMETTRDAESIKDFISRTHEHRKQRQHPQHPQPAKFCRQEPAK